MNKLAKSRSITNARDSRGVPVSYHQPEALAGYESALLAMQTYFGDPVGLIRSTLDVYPDFALGQAFCAVNLLLTSERRYQQMATIHLQAAERCSDRCNDREQALIAATRAMHDGDWLNAAQRLDAVLIAHPHDIFALQAAHLIDFFRGDGINLRQRIARVLPAWDASIPGYSYLLGMYAFGLEEANLYALAEQTAIRALSIEPRDAWAVHAGVHVMEMQGRVDEGIRWLRNREADWAPDNGFAFHNWWHLALFHLDNAQTEQALSIYDEQLVEPVGDLSLGLVDATALLWRLALLGVDTRTRFERLAGVWADKITSEGGYYGFNDYHAALAFAATGNNDLINRVAEFMQRASTGEDGSFSAVSAQTGLPLVQATQAMLDFDDARAVSLLLKVRDAANRFGGSHAQRDIITLTLIRVAQRSGDRATAQHILNERLVAKPDSPLGQRWRREIAAMTD